MKRPVIEQTVVGVLVAGFAIGTITYTLLLINIGWVVFGAAPVWMNGYWALLTGLDPIAAALLLYRRPIGLAVGAVIILSDVGINSYALYGLGLPLGFSSLQFQTLFCGFLLGAAGFLARQGSKPAIALSASKKPSPPTTAIDLAAFPKEVQ